MGKVLQELPRGTRLDLDTVNALINGHNKKVHLINGHHGEDGLALGKFNTGYSPETIQVIVSEDTPAYSVFGVCLNGTDYAPPLITAKQIPNGSLLGLFTNGQIPLTSGQKALVESVGLYRPIKVRVTGTIPLVGEPCGVKLNTFGVSKELQGMVCLSDMHSPGSGMSAEYIWAMRCNDLAHVIGEVTTQAPAYNPTTKVPGAGVLKVQYRNPSGDDLIDAKNPGTGAATWLLPFYNFSTSAVVVGLNVRAESTLGIGLTVFESAATAIPEIAIGKLDATLNATDILSNNIDSTSFAGFASAQGDVYFPVVDSGHLELSAQILNTTLYNLRPFKYSTGDVVELQKYGDYWFVNRAYNWIPFWFGDVSPAESYSKGNIAAIAAGAIKIQAPSGWYYKVSYSGWITVGSIGSLANVAFQVNLNVGGASYIIFCSEDWGTNVGIPGAYPISIVATIPLNQNDVVSVTAADLSGLSTPLTVNGWITIEPLF